MKKPNEIYNFVDKSSTTTGRDDFQWSYLVDEEDKCVYIGFQGSRSPLDYLIDCLSFKVKLYKNQENNFRVHFGYKKVWKENNDTVENKALELMNHYSDYKLIFAGHSYGGCMAQLACEDYHYRSGKKPTLVTFGAPKMLANKKTRDYFRFCIEGDSAQYENINDPMPKLFLGFYHTLETIKVGVSNKKLLWIQMFVNTVKYHCSYKDAATFTDL